MSQKPRKWTPAEVAVFSTLLAFGTAAWVAFPPLLVFYVIGCVLWLVYWYSSSDDPKS
jgi:hypothetical protein